MVPSDIRAKFNPDFFPFMQQVGMLAPLLIEFHPSQVDNVLAVIDSTKLVPTQDIRSMGFIGIREGTINSALLLAQLDAVKMIHIDQTNFAFSQDPRIQKSKPITQKNIFDIPMEVFDKTMTTFENFMDNTTLENLANAPQQVVGQFPPPQTPSYPQPNPQQFFIVPPPPPIGMPPLPPFPGQMGQLPQSQSQQQQTMGQHIVPANLRKPLYSVDMTRQFIGAHLAEQAGLTGRGVKVAVVDTGSDISHPQLDISMDADNVMIGHPNHDENGHGSHCATTVAGRPVVNVHGIRLKGVAPDAHLMSIKCLGGGIGTGRNSDVLKAMELAVYKGAKVISMSLGSADAQGGLQNDPLVRAITALSNSVYKPIFVIAAGNAGPNPKTIGCPGCAPDALTVGAINPADQQIADFSSRGPRYGLIKPDICVTEDTIIFQNEFCNPVYIKDIEENNNVFSINQENNEIDIQTCLKKHKNGIKDVFELRTKNHAIKTTKDHKFLSARFEKEQYTTYKLSSSEQKQINHNLLQLNISHAYIAEQLGIHQVSISRILRGARGTTKNTLNKLSNFLNIKLKGIKNDTRYRWSWYLEWLPLQELQVDDIVLTAIPKIENNTEHILPLIHPKLSKKYTKQAKIPKFMSEELAWLIGLYIGDGSIQKNSKYKQEVAGITWYVYNETKEKCAQYIKTIFNLIGHPQKTGISLTSVEIAEFFMALGLAGTAKTKRIPKWFFSMPQKYKIALLNGLKESDGSSRNETYWEITLANKRLIEDIKYLAEMVGYSTSNIHYRKRSNENLIKLNAKKGYSNELKFFESWTVEIYIKPYHNGTSFRIDSSLNLNNLKPEKIAKITYVGKEPVYDLTINNNHNYIANGFIVHNCAPGVNIYSGTSQGALLDSINDRVIDGYAILSGTSMATPHVSGLMAILCQQYAELTTNLVKEVCKRKGIQKNPNYGWGLINWTWFQNSTS